MEYVEVCVVQNSESPKETEITNPSLENYKIYLLHNQSARYNYFSRIDVPKLNLHKHPPEAIAALCADVLNSRTNASLKPTVRILVIPNEKIKKIARRIRRPLWARSNR